MAYTICPKCHFEEPSSTACSRCGTVFAEWYDAHRPRKPKDPDRAIADAVAMMEHERAIEKQRARQARRIAMIVIAIALAIAFMIVISRYRQVAAQ